MTNLILVLAVSLVLCGASLACDGGSGGSGSGGSGGGSGGSGGGSSGDAGGASSGSDGDGARDMERAAEPYEPRVVDLVEGYEFNVPD